MLSTGTRIDRTSGKILAIDELLKRFPEWTVDLDNAKLSSTSTVRGWDKLPAFTAGGSYKTVARDAPTAKEVAAAAPGAEDWEITLSTPMGPQTMTARIVRDGAAFTGTMSHQMGDQDIAGKISGNTLTWTLNVTKPMSTKLSFEATVDGDTMTGSAKLGMFGKATLTGKRTG